MADLNKNENVDIPEFVDDKSESLNIDKSIFKMSDDELYDDADNEDNQQEEEISNPKPKKSGKGVSVVFLILTIVFLLVAIVACVFALKEKSSVSDLEAQVSQLTAANATLQQQITEKDNTIAAYEAEKQKEEEEVASATRYKVTSDDAIYFRKGAGTSYDKTTYNGSSYAYKNETYDVLGTETDSDGNIWAKVADSVYFCVKYDSETWAEAVTE